MRIYPFTALLAPLLACGGAAATEGGGNSYPMGVETSFNGLMLPEGAHWLVYYSHYSAAHFKDDRGNDSARFANFGIRSDVIAPRLSYVWPGVRVFGANVETRVVQAIVRVDLSAAVARPSPMQALDRSGATTGLADMSLSPVILGWHSPSYHQTAGIDTHLKTGSYNANDRVNTGRNYWQVAPFYALTWFPREGVDVSAKLRYAVNGRNNATHYQSGNEATLEFGAGWRALPGLALGVNGYLYRQTTDDESNGVKALGNRGRVNAIGPYVNWHVTPTIALAAKLQSEFNARNKPQGTRFWLQTRIPF